MLKILASADGKFWGIYDPGADSYPLFCLDVMCPTVIQAIDENGDRYQIKTGEHATQMQLVALSDVRLPTKKL
jgi:hypothetical protein